MSGEGLGTAIFLIYMIVSLLYVGVPLLMGHYLLMAGRNWSYRSYLVFGGMTGPSVMFTVLGHGGLLALFLGILLGGLSVLALRAMLHRGDVENDRPSFLSGKMVERPRLAILVAAGIVGVFGFCVHAVNFVTNLNDPLSGKLLVGVFWPILRFASALGLTLLLVRFCKPWFGEISNLWIYATVAVMLKLLSIVSLLIRYGADIGLSYFLYTPMTGLLWSVAMAWMLVSVYQNLVLPGEPEYSTPAGGEKA